jgi:hypothetical protein
LFSAPELVHDAVRGNEELDAANEEAQRDQDMGGPEKEAEYDQDEQHRQDEQDTSPKDPKEKQVSNDRHPINCCADLDAYKSHYSI